jgi:Protein of unknown function (DUF3105)
MLGLAAGATLLAACGDSTTTPPTSIKFVGNDTCPTAGASPYAPMPPGTNGSPVGQPIDEMPHNHIAPPAKVQYNHDPPTSGCHYSLGPPDPAPIQPGVYGQVIAPEHWVHNLEHGYIAVLYNCPQGCPDDVQKLIAWRKTLPPDPAANGAIPYAKVIVLPWPSMAKKFAAVAWDWYIGWDTLDISKVQAFYDNHVGHSPESPTAP